MRCLVLCALLPVFAIVLEVSSGANITDSRSLASRIVARRYIGINSSLISSTATKTTPTVTQPDPIVQQWSSIENNVKKFTFSLVFENLFPMVERLFDDNNVTMSCQAAVGRVLTDATKLKTYAMESK